MDFWISKWISGFQSGFLDFGVDFWISKWISGFQSGFLDFGVDFWISKWISGFLDFRLDFWISNWISADGVRDFSRDGPLGWPCVVPWRVPPVQLIWRRNVCVCVCIVTFSPTHSRLRPSRISLESWNADSAPLLVFAVRLRGGCAPLT